MKKLLFTGVLAVILMFGFNSASVEVAYDAPGPDPMGVVSMN